MPYAITDIIQWAKISQPLARYGEAKKKATIGGSVDIDLDMKLYNTRRDVEYEYAQNPVSSILFPLGNYLLTLMGVYLFQAQQTTGSGGSISPVTPPTGNSGIYPIVITGADFESDNRTYVNANIVGDNIMLFVAQYNQEWQFAPGFFSYNANGFQINDPSFDANNYPYIIIQNYNP